MVEHEEQWVVFMREVDGAPAALRVDLGWSEVDDEGLHRGSLVEVACTFQTPSPESGGMTPTDEEAEPLADLEDALVAALDGAANAVLVGVLTRDNERRWFFYAGSEDGADSAVATVATATRYDLELSGGPDASWETYHDFLMPDERELSAIANQSVFDALEEAGDIPQRERPIEHFALFRDERSAAAFKAWAVGRGYKVEDVEDPEESGDELFRHGVGFSRVSTAQPEVVLPEIDLATEAAERLGGIYDGWQARAITE